MLRLWIIIALRRCSWALCGNRKDASTLPSTKLNLGCRSASLAPVRQAQGKLRRDGRRQPSPHVLTFFPAGGFLR